MSTQTALTTIRNEVARVIVGQHHVIDQMLIAMLSGGHILLEGVPGVAKTLAARLMSKLMQCSYARIQFTPDLMPADVIGTSVFDPASLQFTFKKGPVFANIVLADEINRAPAKTQSALFEAMEEKQVTVDGTTHLLPSPFHVLATQNPIEQEGTYRLPEAQLDRFLMKIVVEYPSFEEEQDILRRHHSNGSTMNLSDVKAVLSIDDLAAMRESVKNVTVEDGIIKYVATITQATRDSAGLDLGASPRGSIGMLAASKARAVLKGRTFVLPDDVQAVAPPVLRHRIQVAPEREMEGTTADQVIADILRSIDVPR